MFSSSNYATNTERTSCFRIFSRNKQQVLSFCSEYEEGGDGLDEVEQIEGYPEVPVLGAVWI
jgi:hypothetical protein